MLTDHAAECMQYDLLYWLLKCGCPWNISGIARATINHSDLEHMQILRDITGPWLQSDLDCLMIIAGRYEENLDIVVWLREEGALWPESFYDIDNTPNGRGWTWQCVQWAVSNCCGWRTWRCQDLAPEHYECFSNCPEHSGDYCRRNQCFRQQARALFKWAHENGCPCTCDNV
jgi:hypothetical protein